MTHLSRATELAAIADLATGQRHINAKLTVPAAKSRLTRAVSARGAYILPGVHTFDARTRAFLGELSETLSDQCHIEVDEHGLASDNAIVSDFRAMRTLTGCYMDPITIPLTSNVRLRDEAGLAADFTSERHKAIAVSLFSHMFGYRVPASVHLRKEASTTFPQFTRDMDVKKRYLIEGLKNLSPIMKLVHANSMDKLLKEHDTMLAYYVGVRVQPDKVKRTGSGFESKDREVSSLEYALTGGASGRRGVADKTVFINGEAIPDYFGGRRRTVFGMSGSVNYMMTAFFAGFREHYLNEYAFTWKHKGHEDTQFKLSRFSDFIGFDVKQHDQFVAPWLISFFFDQLANRLDPDLVELFRLAYRAPIYQPNPWLDESIGFWLGDPFNTDTFTNDVGLPSGIAFNPDIGKFGMTWIYLCLLDDYFNDVLEVGLEKILKGQHSAYALLNASDDTVITTTSPAFVIHCQHLLSEGKALSPYMILEKEEGISFLGGIAFKKNGEVRVVPNIVSSAVNFFSPERGISDALRGHWATGWIERQGYYSAAPLYSEVYAVIKEVAAKRLRISIDHLAEMALREQKVLSPYAMTETDRLALLNPDSIYYKLDVRDLSPVLRDQLVAMVDADVLEPLIRPYLRDVITRS